MARLLFLRTCLLALCLTSGGGMTQAASTTNAAASGPNPPEFAAPAGAPGTQGPAKDALVPARQAQAPAPSAAAPATDAATSPPRGGSAAPAASAQLEAPAARASRSGRQKAGAGAAKAAAGKDQSNDGYADCVRLWDSGTHMSKRAWSRTCRRIENRLQNLQVENLDVDSIGAKARKKRKSPNAG